MEGWRAVCSSWWHLQLGRVRCLVFCWRQTETMETCGQEWHLLGGMARKDSEEAPDTGQGQDSSCFSWYLSFFFFFRENMHTDAAGSTLDAPGCRGIKQIGASMEEQPGCTCSARRLTFRAARTLKPYTRIVKPYCETHSWLRGSSSDKGHTEDCFWEPGAPLHLPPSHRRMC